MIHIEYGYIGMMVQYIISGWEGIDGCVRYGAEQPLQGQAWDSQGYSVIVRGYDATCWRIILMGTPTKPTKTYSIVGVQSTSN